MNEETQHQSDDFHFFCELYVIYTLETRAFKSKHQPYVSVWKFSKSSQKNNDQVSLFLKTASHLILQCVLLLLEKNIYNIFWKIDFKTGSPVLQAVMGEGGTARLLQVSVPSTSVCLHWHVLGFLNKELFCHKILHGDKVSFNYLPASRGSAFGLSCAGCFVEGELMWALLRQLQQHQSTQIKGSTDSNTLIRDQVRDNVQIKINWTSNVRPWDSENICKAASAYFWVTFKASKYLALQ